MNKIAKEVNLGNKSGMLNKAFENKTAKNVLTKLTDHKALLPVVVLETTVIAGRTHQAQKRGGKVEARERLFEESMASVIWLWGVDTLNKLGDRVNRNLFNQDTTIDFSNEKVAKDQIAGQESILKDPIRRATEGRSKLFKNKLVALKVLKYVASISLATFTIGVAIPKLNQAITEKYLKNNNKTVQPKNIETEPKAVDNKQMIPKSMDAFLNSVKQKNNVAFKGWFNAIKTIGNSLENNNVVKLLTIDGPLSTGRAVNARNKNERREILFRDLSSIVFYMFSTPLIILGLSKIFDNKLGINTKLKPHPTSHLTNTFSEKSNTIKQIFGNNESISTNKLKEKLLGIKDSRLEHNIEELFINKEVQLKLTSENLNKLISSGVNKNLVKDLASLNKQQVVSNELKVISNMLFEIPNDEIKTVSEHTSKISDILFKYTKNGQVADINKELEFINVQLAKSEDKKVKSLINKVANVIKLNKTEGFIAKSQIHELVSGGLINDSKFLSAILNKAHVDDKFESKLSNPTTFVSLSEQRATKKRTKKYIEKLINNVEKIYGHKVSAKQLDKAATIMKNKTMLAKIGYAAVGMSISATFLSYVIPKVQYWITRRSTGQDGFPGVENLNK